MSDFKDKVKLPSNDNAIVIIFDNSFEKVRIDTSPYLIDMLKAAGEANHVMAFSKEYRDCMLHIQVGVELKDQSPKGGRDFFTSDD